MTARHFVYGLCHTQHNVEKQDIWHTPPLYAVTGLLSFEGVLISSTTSREKKSKSQKTCKMCILLMFFAWRLMHSPCQDWLLHNPTRVQTSLLSEDKVSTTFAFKEGFISHQSSEMNRTAVCKTCSEWDNRRSPCEVRNTFALSYSWALTCHLVGGKRVEEIMKHKVIDALLCDSMWKQLRKHLKKQQHKFCLKKGLFVFSLCSPPPWHLIRCYWTVICFFTLKGCLHIWATRHNVSYTTQQANVQCSRTSSEM